MSLKPDVVQKIGWIASGTTIITFLSYLDQIRLNVQGNPGSILLPTATIVSCTFWLAYGALREKKDWPIIVCNTLGVIVASITSITAILFHR